MQKRPIILRNLLIVATPNEVGFQGRSAHMFVFTKYIFYMSVLINGVSQRTLWKCLQLL